jgi:hypothetical protein
MRRLLVFIVAVIALAPVVRAQPVGVSRVLSTFDFEERRLGNVEDLPMHWTKVDGPGLPHYVNGRLSSDLARGGKYSFKFELNGGGLVYRYPAGQIRVQTGAHYRVEGFVHTSPLPNARAQIVAYLTDVDGHTIDGTTRKSQLFATPPDGEPWKRLGVELSADSPDATFLVIELCLLQPEQYASSTLGRQALFDQDIRGAAWWDDVTVAQVPKVRMFTDRPGNVFSRTDPLRLQVLVSDRFTDDLSAQLVIRDATGRTVFQRSGEAMSMATAETLSPGRKQLTLNLPDLPTGWYEAVLVMSSQGQYVGEQTLDLIRLADANGRLPADPRFGVDATQLPFEAWNELTRVLPYLGAGRVKLAVWGKAGDVQQVDPQAFDSVLEKLQELRITPTGCLIDLPPDIAKRESGSSWRQLPHADRALWQPQLAYLIARHANHLDRWQLGADGTDAFVTQPEMRQVYRTIYNEFANLVQHPDLAMPWPAWYDFEGELPATIALSVPSDVLPQQLPLYIQDIRGREGHNLSIALEPVARERYGREVQIRDLAERFCYALVSGADRIDLPLPFTASRPDGDADDGAAPKKIESDSDLEKQPAEMLMILRTLMRVLGGSEFKGKVPIAEGVEAFLFDRGGQGILMLWDRGSQAGVKDLPLNFGPGAARVDLWGNVTPLLNSGVGSRELGVGKNGGGDASPTSDPRPPTPESSDTVAVSVGPMPFFLVDIDGPLAQLRASVRLDNEKVESSFKEHVRKLIFVNPYHTAISGTVKLKVPPGWTINPPTLSFTLNPNERCERELHIQFPYNSFAGNKTIAAQFSVQAERNSTFTLPITVKLGLTDVGLQTLALRDGKDVIVQQMVTNYGDKPIDYTAFAVFPGQARQERLVTNLGPGRTTIKKYRFADVERSPKLRVRSGVKELAGTRILNEEVEIQ